LNGLTVLGLTLVLLAGTAGWGQFALRVLYRFGLLNEALEINWIHIPLGIGTFAIYAGLLVTLCWAYALPLLLWHFIGAVYWVHEHRSTLRTSTSKMLDVGRWLVVIAVLGLTATGICATRLFEFYDDMPSYVYLAQRLVATGGLVDPFNNRRIVSMGLSSVYQSMYVGSTGIQSIFAFDNLFAQLALLIMVATYLRQKRVGLLLSTVLLAALTAGSSAVVIFNLSPRISLTFLSVAVVLLLIEWIPRDKKDAVGLAVAAGLVVCALFELRPENAVAVVVALFGVVMFRRKYLATYVPVTVATCVLAIAPWSVALYRSSKSFLYPLMSGTAVSGWGVDTKDRTFLRVLSSFWEAFRFNYGLYVVLLVAVVIAVGFVRRNYSTDALIALLFFAVGSVISLAMTTYELYGHYAGGIARYFGPTCLSLAVVTILLLTTHDAERREAGLVRSKPLAGSPAAISTWLTERSSAVSAVLLIVVSMLGYQSLDGTMASSAPILSIDFATSTKTLVSDTVHGLASLTNQDFVVSPLTPLEAKFAEINHAVPEHAHVLSAIETPSLLDLSKFSVYTLDWPGADSIGRGLPLTSGSSALMTYLRHVGVSEVLVQSPTDAYNLYDTSAVQFGLSSKVYEYHYQSLMIERWDTDVKAVLSSGQYEVRYFGDYALISTTPSGVGTLNPTELRQLNYFENL
jgi:hypothetical protein